MTWSPRTHWQAAEPDFGWSEFTSVWRARRLSPATRTCGRRSARFTGSPAGYRQADLMELLTSPHHRRRTTECPRPSSALAGHRCRQPVVDCRRTSLARLAGRTVAAPGPVRSIDALVDDDLQLALYLCYELHYGVVADGDDALEWDPRARWSSAPDSRRRSSRPCATVCRSSRISLSVSWSLF